MQITSTATPAASGAWARASEGSPQGAQGAGMQGMAEALGIPVGQDGDGDSEGTEGSDFGGAMAMAQVLAAAAKPGDSPKQGAAPGVYASGSQAPSGRASGKIDKNLPRGAGGGEEQGSLIQKMAVSSNTGVDVAGLKPWSRDWVMEGGMHRHPAQKTLVSGDQGGESADPTSQLAKLASLLSGATATNSGSASAAAPVTVAAAAARGAPRGTPTDPVAEPPAMAGMEATGELAPQFSAESVAEAGGGQQARQKSLSGDDFLSLRQDIAGDQAMAAPPGAPGGRTSAAARNLKVLDGGTSQAGGQIGGLKERPGKGGLTQGLSKPAGGVGAGGLGNDTLGLIHPEMNGKAAALGATSLPFAAASGTLKVDGSVVPGSMQRNRLSSESVLGVSESIRQLTTAGGGEMRIRLKPDHLGELHLRVSAGGKAGSDIGLQIQASDERAKRILEESISSLKESLSGQNLNLSKIDVQVAQSLNASSGAGFGQQDGSGNSQNPFSQDLGAGQAFDQGRGRHGTDRGDGQGDSARPGGLRSAPASGRGFTAAPSRQAGRIDVMA
jgi:hypothetical protein